MRIKKFIASLIAGALVFTVLGFGNVVSSAVVTDFSDVDEWDTYNMAIEYLREDEVVVGYEDGTYGIDQDINRAEFLKIVMEVSEYEAEGEDCYPDVTDQWFASYICAATDLGFVDGYDDGYFRPENDINFAEASKMITNILGMPVVTEADQWFSGYVLALEDTDSIPAEIDSFDKKITRGEMAEMIWRIDTETTYKVSNTYSNIQAGQTVKEYGGELMTFESCGEIADYMEDNAYEDYYYWDEEVWTEDADAMVDAPAATEGEGVEKAAAEIGVGDAADDYSTTNIQVEGVDEADIIKNDGQYIYLIKDDTVRIVDAYPPGGMVELDQVTFGDESFYPYEMYVDTDRLVVIGGSYSDIFVDYDYYGYYSTVTSVYILDISDKSNVELLRKLDFEGYYNTSRKVDDTVYLVANQYNYYWYWGEGWTDKNLVPLFEDSAGGGVEPVTLCGEVRYMPGNVNSTDYTIVAAIPVDDASAAVEEEVIMGSYGDVYASRDNLYIAEPRYDLYWWYEESGNTEETYVHRFALDETNIEYDGMGTVPGTTLNQFSMDEDGDYFRIATTEGGWWSMEVPTNGVYVLDGDLDLIGSVEGLAPGEEIYSVRFIGDRVYMVTYVQLDPLFVIDLSDPYNPEVLGELHIPGVSDYLHPYDENHLIGFGLESLSEGDIEEMGWSWFQGIKLSMFDVTDVENPVELHKVVIGDRGTWSELNYNHKALLFDKEKGIIAFPVLLAEIPQSVKDDLALDAWIYGDYTFQGAYVYDVSIENGFELRGTISHYEESELGDDFDYYYDYGDNKDVERILYIGDYFYTVSQMFVQANEMDSLDETKSLELAD
jgi:uncharacterized secreted protein with C-terminal beta-propeller domain